MKAILHIFIVPLYFMLHYFLVIVSTLEWEKLRLIQL